MAARRRSRTQAEYHASLDWNIRDAEEALILAAQMRNWKNVIKYITADPRGRVR